MDKQTLKLLEGSIEKWDNIVNNGGSDHGTGNCPLCRTFLLYGGHCKGCPVEKKTGEAGCGDTPYSKWYDHKEHNHKNGYLAPIECRWCRKYAEDELKFLQSLLPTPALPTSEVK